ncbi:PREDICTED: T-cell-interacting, activating receptor on myeloid cells protein 1-like [Gekko japonicus]|uniref:T-cell-interacting, activating receptor on myeloid cells protein 1-like n=1 Tax=Gekko japonicus TaxID=146911 RepID=UPI00074FE3F2|nr:PREDICTED: T-cell-interacting, activating receptor on myeloid cells protein 1-like [Gekko japonicus]
MIVSLYTEDPSLTKPFIKVSPRGKLTLGSNVTIECQSKENGLTFSLRKSGKEIASQKTEPHGNTAKFLLSVGRTEEDAGSYICQCQHRKNPFVWSEPSDPVELVVTVTSSTEIVVRLGAAGLVLLALGLIVAEAAYSWRKGEL